MTRPHWSEWLRELDACPEAVSWARGYATERAAYDACERPDWMLWALVQRHGYRGATAEATVRCAWTALSHYELRHPADKRPRAALQTTRRWARGQASHDEVRAAVYAAADAADAADGSKAQQRMVRIIRRLIPNPARLNKWPRKRSRT